MLVFRGRRDAHLEALEGSLLEAGIAAEDLSGQSAPQSSGVMQPSQVLQGRQQRQPVLGQASPQPSSGTRMCHPSLCFRMQQTGFFAASIKHHMFHAPQLLRMQWTSLSTTFIRHPHELRVTATQDTPYRPCYFFITHPMRHASVLLRMQRTGLSPVSPSTATQDALTCYKPCMHAWMNCCRLLKVDD